MYFPDYCSQREPDLLSQNWKTKRGNHGHAGLLAGCVMQTVNQTGKTVHARRLAKDAHEIDTATDSSLDHMHHQQCRSCEQISCNNIHHYSRLILLMQQY